MGVDGTTNALLVRPPDTYRHAAGANCRPPLRVYSLFSVETLARKPCLPLYRRLYSRSLFLAEAVTKLPLVY